MKSSTLITLIVAVAAFAFAPVLMAEKISTKEDGWYRWEVEAGKGGQRSCCYNYHNGNLERKGCRLGRGGDSYYVTEPCEDLSTTMQIFVEIKKGRIRDIRPLSSSCPVTTDEDVKTFDNVSEAQSVAWLMDAIEKDHRIADEAVMSLSFHSKDLALESLVELLEDRKQDHDTREQAMFWLVQSDYDEAYAYLDRLLK